MIETSLEEDPRVLFEAAWLPRKPLCASAKEGPYRRRRRSEALKRPYIEVNPLCVQSLIVADIDTHPAEGLAEELGLPAPSFAVCKRAEVPTGHIGYALHTPVVLTDAARRRPINLLARVETGLRDVLGGDLGYAGRIMKNPISPGEYEFTCWGDFDFPKYGLKDLASALANLGALPAWNDPRPRKSAGVGRNIDIFDRTRTWSYRAIKRYWASGFTAWTEATYEKACALNLALEAEEREPLPEREIYHLARSISKWTWDKFTPETFIKIQSARGRKGGLASGRARREKQFSKWRNA